MTTTPYILCVDDDKTILMSLKAQLKHLFGARFHYEIAESAAEAWEVIEELKDEGETVSLIISDWLMPGIKGDEFLIQIHEKYPDIVKILLSGEANQEAVDKAEGMGALSCYVHKPWTKEKLYDLINAHVH